jgi:hypothetical protein
MSKLDENFAKGFENFLKQYLRELFEGYLQGESIGLHRVARGVHIVSKRDLEVDHCANIYTGEEKIRGHVIQINRGEIIVTADAEVSVKATMLQVRSGKIYQLTEVDKVHWIVW